MNLVEMMCGESDSAFDQLCAHGNHVFGHSVYCHSDRPDMPRKCLRGRYGFEDRDTQRECPGFEMNPNFEEAHNG